MYALTQETDEKLFEFLINAVEKIEYYSNFFSVYRKRINIKLSDFPFLTQQVVQRESSHFLCKKYQRYPDIENLLFKRHLGALGILMEIYWDSRDEARSQTFLWEYRKKRFHITKDEKCCVFCTAEYVGNKVMNVMPKHLSQDGKALTFSMQDLSLERLQWCWETILAFDPVWMILPPSIALMLAENVAAENQPIPISLRYMEMYGETVDMQTEKKIQNLFHVQTGNVYATQAAGPIAASCAHGNLHMFSENAVVEVIRDGKPVMDDEGDIYITSLQNTAMPLIRLKTGERGLLRSVPCACGQQSPMLHLTCGRTCDFITTPSGRKVSAFLLRSIVEYTNEEVSRCLSHIRFRQNGYDRMDVILRTKPAFSNWGQEISRVFKEKICDSQLKEIQWNFSYENSLSV